MSIIIHVRRSHAPTGTDRYQMPQGHDSYGRIHGGRESMREERDFLLCSLMLLWRSLQPMSSKITGERTYLHHNRNVMFLAKINFYELNFRDYLNII